MVLQGGKRVQGESKGVRVNDTSCVTGFIFKGGYLGEGKAVRAS